MLNRRRALLGIGAATFGGLQRLLAARNQIGRSAVARTSFIASSAGPQAVAESQLREDITRIASRTYSEEGVPMFLACVNLTGKGTPPRPTALNKKVASAFQRYSDEWQHVKPEAPVTDVAKIVEFIADKDFAHGGTEVSL